MERKAFMFDMVLSELEDAVGAENVSTREADKIVYGVDYFWVSRMWADKGQLPPGGGLYRTPRFGRRGLQGPQDR